MHFNYYGLNQDFLTIKMEIIYNSFSNRHGIVIIQPQPQNLSLHIYSIYTIHNYKLL